MKAKYFKSENVLRELPEGINELVRDGKFELAAQSQERQKESLSTIPCSSECNWEDGQVLTEGKDFVIQEKPHVPSECGCEKDYMWCPFNPTATEVPDDEKVKLLIATPTAIPIESEDELWDEVDDYIGELTKNETHNGFTLGEQILSKLKSKYQILKKHGKED